MTSDESPAPLLKVELSLSQLPKWVTAFKENRIGALERLSNEFKSVIEGSIDAILKAEIKLFLSSSGQELNKSNGYNPTRSYFIKGIGGIQIKIPRDRQGKFQSDVVPSYERIDPRISEDIAVLHLAGVSTRMINLVSKRLLGVEINKDSVTESLHALTPSGKYGACAPHSPQIRTCAINASGSSIK